MQAKLFEVVDNATKYSVLVVKYKGGSEKEQWLLDRVGLGEGGYPLQLTDLESGRTERDPFRWYDTGRTLGLAHRYLMQDGVFDSLQSGDRIDVRSFLNSELNLV